MALTKCIDCGQEVSTSAKTCPRCGAPIDSITPPQQQLQQLQQPPQQPQQVVQQQQVEPMPATKRIVEPKKKGSWGKFFLGLLLGFVLGALASYILFAPGGFLNKAQGGNDSITAQTDSVTHPVHNDKSSKEARSHNKSSHKANKESGKHKDEANNKDSKDSKEEEPNPEKSRKEIGTIMKDAKKKSDVKNLRDALNK